LWRPVSDETHRTNDLRLAILLLLINIAELVFFAKCDDEFSKLELSAAMIHSFRDDKMRTIRRLRRFFEEWRQEAGARRQEQDCGFAAVPCGKPQRTMQSGCCLDTALME
jgi:hypothetical protein